jgi:hypothetical protein
MNEAMKDMDREVNYLQQLKGLLLYDLQNETKTINKMKLGS